MQRLPIVYVRGYAGSTAGIDEQVDDPFYGFNRGATHVRVNGDGDPTFYQFEGPLLRLMIDENYRLLVQGDQRRFLSNAKPDELATNSIWVYRFYDQAATTFGPEPKEGFFDRLVDKVRDRVSDNGFDIEEAANGLYRLVETVIEKTGSPKVFLVAHSMGGLVIRCMIQKLCGHDNRRQATDIVDKVFTYGTPHGGIDFNISALDWVQELFGPAGSDIFAPEKMWGYLGAGRKFGEEPPDDVEWDPQALDPTVFSPTNIFCLIGTDPHDYGVTRKVIGPKSDGLVRIERAYVRGANRAYVYKSHSGSYGEVNSEEGYQNLRRFLFGRWAVTLSMAAMPEYPARLEGLPDDHWARAAWQADMRLAIRGLGIVMSEQLTSHHCPIQINDELRRRPGEPVTLASTYLIDPDHLKELAHERNDPASREAHGKRLRYALSLRISKIQEHDGHIRTSNHLEQVPDWADALIVDVGTDDAGKGVRAWVAWNSEVPGPNDDVDPISSRLNDAARREPISLDRNGGQMVGRVELPPIAKTLGVIGPDAYLRITVDDRAPGL